jgi:anthranilate synthase/aminodeoxychorismate synthase-like glutamine amidotransferase
MKKQNKKINTNTRRVVVVNHNDSFTYNMVAHLELLGAEVHVAQTYASIAEVVKFRPTHIVLSAGYGHPKNVRLFHEVLNHFEEFIPIFGICLGHQVIGLHYGAPIVKGEKIMHGKASKIFHNGEGVFTGIRDRFGAQRYHSFVIKRGSLPSGKLRQTARTSDGTVMGVRSVKYPHIIGVQFHPESYFTEYGSEIFANVLSLSKS